MKKEDILRNLLDTGIIPVIRTDSPEKALKVADAILEGGIKTLEITMTVPGAVDLIKKLNEKIGKDILLGAGTVLDAETARLCILAGAKFVIGPCINQGMIEVCKRYSVVAIPGAMTPTEILKAWESGADIVKVFPAADLGGPSYIRAIKAPLPHILLNPTGGVSLENAADFIRAGADIISVGSHLVDKKAVEEEKYEVITENAKRFKEEVEKGRRK